MLGLHPAQSPSQLLFERIVQIADVAQPSAKHPIQLHIGNNGVPEMQTREAELAAVWDIFRNHIAQELRAPGGQAFDKDLGKEYGILPINHLPRWIQLWSSTYNEEASRSFDFKGERVRDASHPQWPVVEAIQERYRQASVDESLKKVDVMMRLLGNVVIVPHLDGENDELVIHQYKSHRVRVVENPNNPSRPLATALIGTSREIKSNGETEFVEVATVFTGDTQATIRKGKVKQIDAITSQPIVHCFNSLPDNESGYFVEAPGAILADLAIRIMNDGYSDINYTSLMQGAGLMQIFGLPADQVVKIGPGRAIRFPGDSDRREGVEFAAPGAPLAERVEVLLAFVEAVRQAYGIPTSSIDANTDASGAAIVQANGPLAEIRKERAKTFRPIETALLRTTLSQLNGRDPRVANIDPKDWDVTVSYGAPQASHSVQDKISQEKHDLEIGVRTEAEILLERQPDAFDSADEAQAELDRRKEVNSNASPEKAVADGNEDLNATKHNDNSLENDKANSQTKETI